VRVREARQQEDIKSFKGLRQSSPCKSGRSVGRPIDRRPAASKPLTGGRPRCCGLLLAALGLSNAIVVLLMGPDPRNRPHPLARGKTDASRAARLPRRAALPLRRPCRDRLTMPERIGIRSVQPQILTISLRQDSQFFDKILAIFRKSFSLSTASDAAYRKTRKGLTSERRDGRKATVIPGAWPSRVCPVKE